MKIFCHGTGSISAAGDNNASAWETYAAGKVAWAIDEATGLPVYRVNHLPEDARIAGFAESTSADRASVLALYAAQQAVRQAGWEGSDFAILVGCSRGPTESWEQYFSAFEKPEGLTPRTSPQTTLGSIGFALAEFFGVQSLASSLSVTCSSGMHALLHGVALLRAGMVDRVLVGGTEASLTPFTLAMMQSLRICAKAPEQGEHACRPLDSPASGMAIGEGAAFLALSREPANYELSALAFARESAGSSTGITPQGAALQQTMREAIQQGGWPDCIVTHAPGTRRGDAAEVAAVRAVYEHQPEDEVLTSFKWATGHTFGASGPLALVAAMTMMERGEWVPTPYRNSPQTPWALGNVLVNATGFGGNTVTVGVRKVVN